MFPFPEKQQCKYQSDPRLVSLSRGNRTSKQTTSMPFLARHLGPRASKSMSPGKLHSPLRSKEQPAEAVCRKSPEVRPLSASSKTRKPKKTTTSPLGAPNDRKEWVPLSGLDWWFGFPFTLYKMGGSVHSFPFTFETIQKGCTRERSIEQNESKAMLDHSEKKKETLVRGSPCTKYCNSQTGKKGTPQ